MYRGVIAAVMSAVVGVLALIMVSPVSTPVFAQLGSGKTMRIIVPFAPAGSSDVLARILQASLQQELKQTIIVENRAGAGTNIGTAEVARAEPDGYTLLLTSSAFVVYGSSGTVSNTASAMNASVPSEPITSLRKISSGVSGNRSSWTNTARPSSSWSSVNRCGTRLMCRK